MSDNPLVDAIENILLTPSSDFYIAKMLYDPGGNALDPRTVTSLTLPDIKMMDIPMSVTLKNLVVNGLSDVQVAMDGNGNPEISCDGDTVTFHAQLPNTNPQYQRPAGVLHPAQAAADLYVSIDGQPMPPGTLALTINSVADLMGVFTATETQNGNLNTLEINFTQLAVNPRLTPGNLTITVKLATAFTPTINHVLNQAANQKLLMDQLNAQLSSKPLLQGMSQVATQKARQALASNQAVA